MAVTPQYFDMYFLQTRGIFLGEKKQKTGKLTLLHFSLLILRSHSGFAGCPSNVLYSENIQLFLTYRVYLSGLLSPFQSEGSLSVFTVHSIPPSWRLQSSYSVACLSLWVCVMFPPGLIQFVRLWPEHCRGDADLFPSGPVWWCGFHLSPLALSPWLRWCLPDFSTVELLFFSL